MKHYLKSQLIALTAIILLLLAVGLMEGTDMDNTVTIWRVLGVIASFITSGLMLIWFGLREGFYL